MAEDSVLWFGNFRIDLRKEGLWREHERLPLPPKAFALLRYLVEHPGQLVTRETLLGAIWSDTVVGDAVLTVGIGELRKALGDDPQAPRFIETVPRRGYRWVGRLTDRSSAARGSNWNGHHFSVSTHLPHASPVVGRETELRHLHTWLEEALRGHRQVVFVTGELGIGKTTVVDAFLEQISGRAPIWVGCGQCIEHFGVGEAYLPVLEALGQIGRGSEGQRVVEILNQHAPTWLAQMPALLSASDYEALQRKLFGATRERMLRELAEALETVTAERTMVLVLEDLHWSDYATLDLLAFLARRRPPARLLVLGTYRPAAMSEPEHPLRRVHHELRLHGQCEELVVGRLTEAAVQEYLARRFPAGRGPATLAPVLMQRTEGNPLFMVTVVEEWVMRGVIAESPGGWEVQEAIEAVAVGIPETLRQMVEQQVERLSPEDQRMVEAASVVGVEFSAAAVAAGPDVEATAVEERCQRLVQRHQVLRLCGSEEWPDGTVAARYGLVHALYQQVLYERVPAGRRAWLHRQVGQRLEVAYGAHTDEISAELAVHFERGREYERAVRYLEQAARRALRRSAPLEAIQYLRAALRVLRTLPDTPESAQQELALQTALGLALTVTKGHAAQEVEQAYARAHELCQQVGESPRLFSVLFGLWTFHLTRAEYRTASELCNQLLGLAQRVRDPGLLVEAHGAQGVTCLYLGDFAAAQAHLEQSLALYDPQQHRSHALLYGQDPGPIARAYLALAVWFLGYPDQALQQSQKAITQTRELTHPFSLGFVLGLAGILHNCRREPQAYQERAEEAIALATEHGMTYVLAQGIVGRGRALIQQGRRKEGVEQIQQVLDVWRSEGKALGRPATLAAMAEAYGAMGQVGQGLELLAEAVTTVDSSGERWWEAEVYRLKGELTLQQEARGESAGTAPSSAPVLGLKGSLSPGAAQEAEGDFLRAVEVARRQSAKSWELRAVMSLSRLWQQQGKREEARKLLAEIYGWFTEGFETKDLQEAKALLTELS